MTAALDGAFQLPSSSFGDGGPADPVVAGHGLLTNQECDDEVARVMRDVVWPIRDQLLGRAPQSETVALA